MKNSTLFARSALLVLILGIPNISRADDTPGKVHPYVGLDIYLAGKAGDGLWTDTQGGMQQLSGMGYASVGSIETKGAIGGRFGLMVNVSEPFDIGGSIGYIAGPNSNSMITAVGGGKSAILTDKREVRFFRFLIEPTLNVKMSEKSAFHVTAGLGVAQGRTDETGTCAGNACSVNNSTAKYSSEWTGFSWEISPYFSIDKLLVGLRASGFPPFKGNASNSKIEWTTLGFFTGLRF